MVFPSNKNLKAVADRQAKREREANVTPSCGCIFCDLALAPIRGFHIGQNNELIECPLKGR
jgi:hypothetical protein